MQKMLYKNNRKKNVKSPKSQLYQLLILMNSLMMDFNADGGHPVPLVPGQIQLVTAVYNVHHDIIAVNTEPQAYGFIESSDVYKLKMTSIMIHRNL